MEAINFEHPRDQIVEFMNRIYGYGMTTTRRATSGSALRGLTRVRFSVRTSCA